MAFQPVPDAAKVAVVTTTGFTTLVNTFHFSRPGAWGLPELNVLVLTVGTAWVNDIMPALSSDQVLARVEGRGLRAQDDVSAEYVPPSQVSGGDSSPSLPGNVAFAVTHLTGLTGRANRGRTFFGLLTEGQVTGDTLSAARADTFRDGLNSIRLATAAEGWVMCVVSRRLNNAPRNPPVTIPIIGFRYRDRIVDSQRLRLVGRGI